MGTDLFLILSQIVALDHSLLTEQVGRLSRRHMESVLTGIELILRSSSLSIIISCGLRDGKIRVLT